jgi:hypothetical protein
MAFRVFGVIFCIVSNLFAADFFVGLGKVTDPDILLGEPGHVPGCVSENGGLFKEPSVPDNKASDDIIKLNVSGKRFEIRRSTLCRYEGSPLTCMFHKGLGMKPGELTEKGYFINEDPQIFGYMLNFLRYGTVPNLSRNNQAILNKMAMQWLGEGLLADKPKTKKNKGFKALQKNNRDGKLDWFLFDKTNEEIVGNSDFGAETKKEIEELISEHNKRPIRKKFIYAWSGYGFAIYSLETGFLIGERVKKCGKKQTEDFLDKFLDLHLIENGFFMNKTHYFCTFNREASFSAFDANTNQKILSGQKFRTLDACINALRKTVTSSAQ